MNIPVSEYLGSERAYAGTEEKAALFIYLSIYFNKRKQNCCHSCKNTEKKSKKVKETVGIKTKNIWDSGSKADNDIKEM